MVCWKCGKLGNFKKDCLVRKVNKYDGPTRSKDLEKQQGKNSDLIQNFNFVQN